MIHINNMAQTFHIPYLWTYHATYDMAHIIWDISSGLSYELDQTTCSYDMAHMVLLIA